MHTRYVPKEVRSQMPFLNIPWSTFDKRKPKKLLAEFRQLFSLNRLPHYKWTF